MTTRRPLISLLSISLALAGQACSKNDSGGGRRLSRAVPGCPPGGGPGAKGRSGAGSGPATARARPGTRRGLAGAGTMRHPFVLTENEAKAVDLETVEVTDQPMSSHLGQRGKSSPAPSGWPSSATRSRPGSPRSTSGRAIGSRRASRSSRSRARPWARPSRSTSKAGPISSWPRAITNGKSASSTAARAPARTSRPPRPSGRSPRPASMPPRRSSTSWVLPRSR